jgi:hypothetical protein
MSPACTNPWPPKSKERVISMSADMSSQERFKGDKPNGSAQATGSELATNEATGNGLLERALPQERREWEDRSLSPERRLATYSAYILRELAAQNAALSCLSESEGDALRATKDYQWLLQESQAILRCELTATTFCIRMDTLAQVILDSFYIDREGFHHLMIPAGVGDIEAIKELNRYFAEKNPRFLAEIKMNAFDEVDLPRLEVIGGARDRDINQPRIIEMIPIVPGTVDVWLKIQREVLSKLGLEFVPEIEQALVALAFACLGDARITETVSGIKFPLIPDMFEGKRARGASVVSGMMNNLVEGLHLAKCVQYAVPVQGASGRRINPRTA